MNRTREERMAPQTSAGKLCILHLAALLAVTFGGCGEQSLETPNHRASTFVPEVQTLRVTEESCGGRSQLAGFIESRFDLTLSSERDGPVVRRAVAEGDDVELGSLLVRLDDVRAELVLAQAKALAEEADLNASTPASRRRQLGLELKMARDDLRRGSTLAPRAARVEEIMVEVGEWVKRGTPLVRLVDLNHLRVFLDLSELERLSVEKGQVIPCRSRALGDRVINATIVNLASTARVDTGRFRAELHLATGTTGLLCGMVIDAELTLANKRRGIVLLKTSLSRRFEQDFCYVLKTNGEGTTLAQEVSLTTRPIPGRPDRVEITSGLKVGDQIITGPWNGLSDGVAVLRWTSGKP
ncbi:MAG: HlyD family efflux transporter periplasmic adaptor subunit [Planctomycetota bacterium]